MRSDRNKQRDRERGKAKLAAMSREGEHARDTRLAGRMPYSESARLAAVEKAERWTAIQAERLGYTCDQIMEGIRRGWTAEEVASLTVSEASQLDGPPPRTRADRELIAKLKNAPVLPIRDTENRSRRRDRYLDGPSPYRRVRREVALAAE